MQFSPVQPRSIIYRRIHVAPVLDENGDLDPKLKAPDFDWSGVKVAVETGIGVQENDDPTEFMASLRLKVSNDEGKKCPYEVDVQLVALLEMSEKLGADRREELATVNGLAIVYSALRELIVNLTSRMEYGALVIPGVNFQDHVQQTAKATQVAAPDAK